MIELQTFSDGMKNANAGYSTISSKFGVSYYGAGRSSADFELRQLLIGVVFGWFWESALVSAFLRKCFVPRWLVFMQYIISFGNSGTTALGFTVLDFRNIEFLPEQIPSSERVFGKFMAFKPMQTSLYSHPIFTCNILSIAVYTSSSRLVFSLGSPLGIFLFQHALLSGHTS